MLISHVITSISSKNGGTSTCLRDLIKFLPKEIFNNLFTLESNDDLNIDSNAKCIFFDNSSTIKKILNTEYYKSFKSVETNLFHGHGLWDIPIHNMAVYSKKFNLPYIISPHGMLEPWSLNQNKFKKKLALTLYQESDLKNASCIHATAISEAINIRSLGYTNPIAIIPNGINLDEFPLYKKNKKNKKKLLFLSRIHRKKGIEVLIKSWSELPKEITNGWEVEIVGNGEEKYINNLSKLIYKLDLSNSIKISQPVFGKQKALKFQEADLFVLPTYSENFGIVVAEALASCVPVITTVGAPWEDLNVYNCGDWIDLGKDSLKISLAKMLILPHEILNEMGLRGRNLVESKYSMNAVAQDMSVLYKWILNRKCSELPNFIKLD